MHPRFLCSKTSSDGLQGQDGAGDERGLLLEDRVINGGAEAFIEDLDPEQLRRGGGAVFVGGGDGDVEGQALIGVPGESRFLEALDLGQGDVVEVFARGVDGKGNVTGDGRAEGAGGIGGQLVGDLELGADVIGVCQICFDQMFL